MVIRGNLEDIILPDLLQLPNVSRKTGMLTVHNKNDRATIYFKNGEITHAVFNDIIGEEAIFKLLSLTNGEFEFSSGEIPHIKTIKMKLQNILIEAAKRHDEKASQTATVFTSKKQSIEGLLGRILLKAPPSITSIALVDSKGKEVSCKSRKPGKKVMIEMGMLIDYAYHMKEKYQRGDPIQIIIHDNEGYLAYNRAAKNLGLILVASKDINLGQLFLILKRETDKISEIV